MKHFLYFPLLLLLFFSCKKKDDVPELQFKLKAELMDNIVVLTWSEVNISGVKSVNIYRSSEPIPVPTPDKPINNGLLLTTISDKSITTFTDDNIEPGTNGSLYYRAVIILADRTIASNEEEINTNGFSIDLSNAGFGNIFVNRFPRANIMYLINFSQGTIDVLDYKEKRIINSANVSNVNSALFCPVINQGNEELYIYSGSSVICYNARTLSSKFVIPIPYLGYVYDIEVNNGFLYVLSSNNNTVVRTYNLSTQAMVNQRTIQQYNSSGSNYQGIYVGSVTNKLYFKWLDQYYNSQTGSYIYACRVKSYNLLNGIPNDSTMHNVPQFNIDSLSSGGFTNMNYIQVSPDGKYISCNDRGDVYSVMDGSVHSIVSSNNTNPTAVFSQEGTYIMGKNTNSGISFNVSDIYTLPGFTYKTGIKNPVLSQNTFNSDTYIDNDSLISYNLQQNFQSGINRLTVFFKKIN